MSDSRVGARRATGLLGSRAGYGVSVALGLGASALCAVAVAQPWARATATVSGLPPIEASVNGADIAPIAAALAFVCLAGFGAVLATRGWVRRLLGVVIVVCAGVVLAAAVAPGSTTGLLEDALSARGWAGGEYDQGLAAWRVVAAASAIVVIACGAVVTRFGAAWATMGARYDSPAEARSARTADSRPDAAHEPNAPAGDKDLSDAAMWRALDDGADPTNTT